MKKSNILKHPTISRKVRTSKLKASAVLKRCLDANLDKVVVTGLNKKGELIVTTSCASLSHALSLLGMASHLYHERYSPHQIVTGLYDKD